jgi:hypothetical protein
MSIVDRVERRTMNSGDVRRKGTVNLRLQKLPLFDYFVMVAPIIKAELWGCTAGPQVASIIGMKKELRRACSELRR